MQRFAHAGFLGDVDCYRFSFVTYSESGQSGTELFSRVLCLYSTFVFMVSMPGKNAKKESPVNPLLKYPNVYFALCCALYFAGKNFVIQICGADL